MTREEVIRMAREAGANPASWQIWPPTFSRKVDFTMAELERFTALVAAAEREACAKLAASHQMPYGHCQVSSHASDMTSASIAAGIRERGDNIYNQTDGD